MKDNKNIDRLFQEKLKDFEVFPPNNAWNKIEKNLAPVKVRKRSVPTWVKIASAAAMLLFIFSISAIYFLPKDSIASQFLNFEENEQTVDVDTVLVVEETNKTSKTKLNTAKKIKSTSSKIDIESLEEIAGSDTENSELENETLPNNQLLKKEKYQLYKATDNIDIKQPVSNKFTVATIYAPIYLNSFGDGSGVDSQFGDNPISGNSSYSYGVKFAYQLNDKFSVQSGVNLINMGYTTNNVYVNPNVSVVGFSNLSTSPIDNNLYASKGVASKNAALPLENNIGSLNQVFGYVEIPVELKYNVTNGKVGVNLIGGFSTLLLNKDEVFVETNSFTQSLGESNNLRSINFSGNIGLDVDYSIRKNLYINVSPMFKVQTNTFSKNSGSVLPYYLGVYTGLNYKF
ncbi:Outer membrane protein beta-barrel domain-containing protein [Lutibacter oricola]|uniref:Outer membrane protein beta-barrel domain-containing protein n=1 Tax=Lutibacter oricola TaxID=762486 RepID=A0A1H2RAR7_9FLAO|nr:outer membrane beta-barrel protein [Lutibacter oricola]SDW16507.1 Outer membrane protein beta-barrel domain-containing protein [Lutibacter oricola]